MNGHTLGDWRWDGHISRNLANFLLTSDGRVVLRAIDIKTGDARLIAAAPDLLDAAKQALEALEWVQPSGITSSGGLKSRELAISKLNAAIAKANGNA